MRSKDTDRRKAANAIREGLRCAPKEQRLLALQEEINNNQISQNNKKQQNEPDQDSRSNVPEPEPGNDPPTPKSQGRIILSPKAETKPAGGYLRIVKIELTSQFTIFDMELRAKPGEDMNYSLYSTSSGAFYLRDRQNRITYPLRQISGDIKIAEDQVLPAGGKRAFQIYFDPIPKNLNKIDLMEGNEQLAASQNYWNFKGIILDWQ